MAALGALLLWAAVCGGVRRRAAACGGVRRCAAVGGGRRSAAVLLRGGGRCLVPGLARAGRAVRSKGFASHGDWAAGHG